MKQRWEDWINLILGAWLFFTPFLFGYTGAATAAWNAYIFGAALVILTIIALSAPQPWEEWVDSAIGLWIVISPWILGFSALTAATWNALIIGFVVLILSLEASRASRQVTGT